MKLAKCCSLIIKGAVGQRKKVTAVTFFPARPRLDQRAQIRAKYTKFPRMKSHDFWCIEWIRCPTVKGLKSKMAAKFLANKTSYWCFKLAKTNCFWLLRNAFVTNHDASSWICGRHDVERQNVGCEKWRKAKLRYFSNSTSNYHGFTIYNSKYGIYNIYL